MLDSQTIAAAIVLFIASIYIGHRAWLRVSSLMLTKRRGASSCPVMVIHSDERDWIEGDGRQIGLKRVLVAFDFSDHSEQALKLGLLIAQEYQAELHLLHVLPPFTLNEPEISWYPLGSEGVYHKAARRLQRAVPDEAHLWCKSKNVVSEGQPYREIIHYGRTKRNRSGLHRRARRRLWNSYLVRIERRSRPAASALSGAGRATAKTHPQVGQ
jgi:hypothetical protein